MSVTDDKNVCYWRQKLGDVDNRLRSKWFKIMKAGAGAGVQAQLQVKVKMQVQVCKLRCRWRCRCRCASAGAGADEDAGAGVQAQMQVQVWRWRCVTDEKSVRYWRQKLVHRVKGSTSQEFHESRFTWVCLSLPVLGGFSPFFLPILFSICVWNNVTIFMFQNRFVVL